MCVSAAPCVMLDFLAGQGWDTEQSDSRLPGLIL